MTEHAPLFLELDEVLALHDEQIERYGGTPGVRDMHLLASAIGTPTATFDGALLHPSVVEQAAAYLFHLCKNHRVSGAARQQVRLTQSADRNAAARASTSARHCKVECTPPTNSGSRPGRAASADATTPSSSPTITGL